MAEAFSKAWEHREEIRSPKALWSWLKKTIKNDAFDSWKKDGIIKFVPLDEQRDLPVQPLSNDADEKILIIWAAVYRLKKADQELMELRYKDGLTIREIAGLLRVSENVVKVRLSRIREEVRQNIHSSSGRDKSSVC